MSWLSTALPKPNGSKFADQPKALVLHFSFDDHLQYILVSFLKETGKKKIFGRKLK